MRACLRVLACLLPNLSGEEDRNSSIVRTYPKVNVQTPATAKLPVSDLERNRHLVVFVQRLVEALPRVRFQLDVVRAGETTEEEA